MVKTMKQLITGLLLSSMAMLSACQPNQPQAAAQADAQQVQTAKSKDTGKQDKSSKSAQSQPTRCNNQLILQSYDQMRSDVQVLGCGKVKAVLADDNKGSRHQKFIVTLDGSRHTVLIAHNIDLAPRVAGIKKGDEVAFFGEYEYTEQGGVVHWTHHDPASRHQHGYIKHNSNIYQ